MDFQSELHPHRRLNPLTGEWILVSPQRARRPWLGQQEARAETALPAYDPLCYLCPGNQRAGTAVNPPYSGPFVFPNDFAAILPESPLSGGRADGLLRCEPVRGECRVLCFSPRHDLSLPRMSVEQIGAVVEAWSAQMAELGARHRWVQIFENKGAAMGCSNPHPHGQIWAGNFLPRCAFLEDERQRQYFAQTGRPLLLDYLEVELREEIRLVETNAHWVALVPYWATWPFEVLLLPRRPVPRLTDLSAPERRALGEILRRTLIRYDNLFECSFPYSMGWHGAPTGESAPDGAPWQLHAHFYPPLLRSATVKKFMVGYELLAEAQRDLTPEQAAERLRALSQTHYAEREVGAGQP